MASRAVSFQPWATRRPNCVAPAPRARIAPAVAAIAPASVNRIALTSINWIAPKGATIALTITWIAPTGATIAPTRVSGIARADARNAPYAQRARSEEHTSEL